MRSACPRSSFWFCLASLCVHTQFLLVRGKYGWLGHNWMGCFTPENEELWVANIRPKQLDEDYGVPVDEYCRETSVGSGIFQREWSKAGTVQMDCNTYTATIPMLEQG